MFTLEIRLVWPLASSQQIIQNCDNAIEVGSSYRKEDKVSRAVVKWVSNPEEFHLQVLSDPGVNFSIHRAPIG